MPSLSPVQRDVLTCLRDEPGAHLDTFWGVSGVDFWSEAKGNELYFCKTSTYCALRRRDWIDLCCIQPHTGNRYKITAAGRRALEGK